MKKMLFLGLIVALALGALPAFGEMDNRDFTVSTVTTNVGTKAYTLRGDVAGINVVIPANKTCTVAIATAEATIFSKADMTSATDGFFPILVPAYSTAAAALTVVDAGSNTNAVYVKAPMAGAVTATFTPKADTTGTNSYTATVIYRK